MSTKIGMNAILDKIPKAEIRIGGRLASPFIVFGIAGFCLAALLIVIFSVQHGRSLAIALALPPLIVSIFIILGLLRRLIFGAESHHLMEWALISLGLVTGVLWFIDENIFLWLDILAIAASFGLAVGRIGCASHGCCYGLRSEIGIFYGGRSPAGVGRRFPIQLVESALWLILAISGAFLSLQGDPSGRATVVVLVGYGAGRLVLQSLRGSRNRHIWFSRCLALILLLTGLAIDWYIQPWPVSHFAILASAMILVLILLVTRSYWLDSPALLSQDACDQLYNFGSKLRGMPPASKVERLSIDSHIIEATWIEQDEAVWLMVSFCTADPNADLSLGVARIAVAELGAGLAVQGPEPELLVSNPQRASVQFLLERLTWAT